MGPAIDEVETKEEGQQQHVDELVAVWCCRSPSWEM